MNDMNDDTRSDRRAMTERDDRVRLVPPSGAPAPVVFDSPHSGRLYPPDFRPAVGLDLLKGGEDSFVDLLLEDAPAHGVTLVAAPFARTYIDPNRAPDDLDEGLLDAPWPEPVEPSDKTERGVGLIFKLIGPGVPIYDRRLSVAEARDRIEGFWWPYHNALSGTLDAIHERSGMVWHVNWHSMQPLGSKLSPDPGRQRPDFVLGDLDGRSCAPDFTRLVAEALEELGYSVAINDPYKGAEILRRYGRPADGRHSLQIEINRALYLDEATLAKHEGFQGLRADLGRLAERIGRHARSQLAEPARAAPRRSGIRP